MKPTTERTVMPGQASRRKRRAERAFSLVEMLVVLAIIGTLASVVTLAVTRAMDGQEEKQCLDNMVLIEAAKDEYVRDHPGATAVDPAEFRRYFRFGIPRCPRDPNADYPNWDDLNASVTCPMHPANAPKLNGH